MKKGTVGRGIAIPLFIIALSAFNFTRLQGSECIRAIHIVTLLTMGMAIGMLIMNVITFIKNKQA